MSICRRLLQLGALMALLSGCSTPATGVHAPTPPLASVTGSNRPVADTVPAPATTTAQTRNSRLKPEISLFLNTLSTERNLALPALQAALKSAHYNATVARLIAPSPPGQKVWRSWLTYRSRFVEPKRIGWGVSFYDEHRAQLNEAAQRFGVPASIITAIIGVETLYGRDMGNFRVLDALTTLAFDYPDPAKPERATMFREQLADFLTLALRGKLDLETRGSYAGAIGLPQFMPSSIQHYAIDGDNDGHIDLSNSTRDAIMSVGHFLAEHGWQRGIPVFAPVDISAPPAELLEGGLVPKQTWATLRAAGASLQPGATTSEWSTQALGVVDLVEEARKTAQYRVGTPNFFVLTQYNRSYFYATAVADLATAIESANRR